MEIRRSPSFLRVSILANLARRCPIEQRPGRVGLGSAADGSLEIILSRLAIVLVCDSLGVPKPTVHDVRWELVSEFGSSAAAQVDSQARPRLHTRTTDDSLELGSQVDPLPIGGTVFGSTAVSIDAPLGSRSGLLAPLVAVV